jgi:hypothetical protein
LDAVPLVAAAADGHCVSTAKLGGAPQLYHLDAASPSEARSSQRQAGGGGSYGRIRVVGGTDSFAAALSSQGATIGYRSVDGAGAPLGRALAPVSTNWDDNPNALVAAHDGFVLAANTSSMPGGSLDQITVNHLGCP